MISQNEIKHIKSLHQKKFREQEGLFIVEGEKLLRELMESDWHIEKICATQEWINKTAVPGKLTVQEIKQHELERISALTSPNEVLAVVRQRTFSFDAELATKGMTLLAEDLRDPGNLGTIIRIADWFGIRQVVCSPSSVDLFNPKTVQATMGSLFHLPVVYSEIADTAIKLKDLHIPLYGAVMDGASLYECKLPSALALLMGSESHGISASSENFLDHRITIPRFGSAESLNVAVATGIICSHYRAI